MIKNLLIKVIKFYKKNLSGLKSAPCCRFHPSCSTYAIEAIETYGALKGGIMALYRFFRCNPFSKGGYDPVPVKGHKKKEK